MLFIYHFFGELTLSLFIFGLLFGKLHIAKQCCEQAFKYQLTHVANCNVVWEFEVLDTQ